MPAATTMSSQPSALRSSTLGPQGQYVSTPRESDTSSNRPPPRFAKSALPKMKPAFPAGKKSAGGGAEAALRGSVAPSPGGVLGHPSAGMSGTKRGGRPPPPESKNFAPLAPPRGLGGECFVP